MKVRQARLHQQVHELQAREQAPALARRRSLPKGARSVQGQRLRHLQLKGAPVRGPDGVRDGQLQHLAWQARQGEGAVAARERGEVG